MAQTRLNTSEEHCKISKDAKFERDLLKSNKDIALQKHCILRLYKGMVSASFVPPTIQTSVKSLLCDFAEQYLRSLLTYHF